MYGKGRWCIVKILVMSDSHSSLGFMRLSIDKIRPQHVIHLGDCYEDATAMAEEYPHIRFHQVPGNGGSRGPDGTAPLVMCYDIAGVRIFMTHGHLHGVKSGGTDKLVSEARARDARAALFGHTHEALCYWEEDGFLVMNPGSCRGYGGSVALMEVEDGKIVTCRILRQAELDEM